ncbi:menaquinone-specific isochorismate synthase [Bacillus sp. 1NLA3E]|nr:menaquinone-specific isochorismate synthase [Bacillus sp. 1NLA3E]
MLLLGGFFLVILHDSELKMRIFEAIARAKALAAPVLVSEVHKIEHIEPLSFFYSGCEKYFGERFFWKDPSDQAFFVGLGICKQIQTDQSADRFIDVHNEWKRFTENSMIFNPYTHNGLGPTMFGGFSFDPLKAKTTLWTKFSHSLFHIPKYMLSIIDGQAYLTSNILCTQHDDDSLVGKINREREQLLASAKVGKEYRESHLAKTEEIQPDAWKKTVDDIADALKKGPLKKVVLARELRLHFHEPIQVEKVLEHFLLEQKASFVFAFESNGDCFVGASPERLLKKSGNDLFTTCLAGSIKRGKTVEDDKRLEQDILTDQKNLIEHHYVVQMIKEAMSEVCQQVIIPERPALMKMRDIQHLYTPVIGKTDGHTSLLQIVERLHPTPALGGLPKKEAVEKIREVELMDRGLYGGPIGWMDYRENGEFAVAIRSGLIQGDQASLFAGCGVVADSNSESEYLETNIKFRPMLTALGGEGI